MKETIATIPLMNAFHADDECPFCYLEREAEQHAISFILGSAYMEDDIRAKTDATGFCRHHFKMMYDYGNRLGNALILSTHLKKLNQELDDELAHFTPGKSSFIKRMKHTDVSSGNAPKTPLGAWIAAKTTDCYVCDHFHQIYGRYLDTFFDLYKKNEDVEISPSLLLLKRSFPSYIYTVRSRTPRTCREKLQKRRGERYYVGKND